jgi:hypothetical protein
MGTTRKEYGYYVYGPNDDEVEKLYRNQVEATVVQNGKNAAGGVTLDSATNGASVF